MSRAELLALPAVVDVVTAGRALGIGRTTAYQLARAGAFPCPVIRIGHMLRVPTAGLWQVLGVVDVAEPDAVTPQERGGQ